MPKIVYYGNMRIHRLILFIGLATLLIIPLTACHSSPPSPKPIYLTEQQVISIVQVYGVSTIKISGEAVSPCGQWAATYEGENKWRIRGAVVATIDNVSHYRQTTWLYDIPNLELISLEGTSLPEEQKPSWTRNPFR